MLKTIIRHGCRLRPALNMRLSTSVNHRLHTLSPSSTYQNGQVCKKKAKSIILLRKSFVFIALALRICITSYSDP